MMGSLADHALAAGGQVVGVLPQSLREREPPHPGLSALHVVPDLLQRKATMLALSDIFVVLPGGLGTLDELLEVWTLTMIDGSHRPLAMVNEGAYFDGLFDFLCHAEAAGFVTSAAAQWATRLPAIDALAGWLDECAQIVVQKDSDSVSNRSKLQAEAP